MSDDLPYRAEYAKSGRASCKSCKSPIAKDTLRLAVMVQSPMFDGKTPHWYHFMCFFGRQRPKSVGDISHFDSLRWEDQEKIKAKIENAVGGGDVVDGKGKGKGKGKGNKRSADVANLKDFTVEYAKSNRSMCRGCNQMIMKDEVRISKKDYESERAKMYGGHDSWHHVDCFAKLRDELEFWESGEILPGIKTLKKDDQIMVKQALVKVEKKVKSEDGPTAPKKSKPSKEEEEEVKKQCKEMYKYRDQLKKELRKKDLQFMLEFNKQEIPTGEEQLQSDIMTFGNLKPCEECKRGQLVFRSGVGYQCLGDLTEWTKCQNKTLKPKRNPFKVPPELAAKHPFLEQYKYVPQKRTIILHESSASTSTSSNGDDMKNFCMLDGSETALDSTIEAMTFISAQIEIIAISRQTYKGSHRFRTFLATDYGAFGVGSGYKREKSVNTWLSIISTPEEVENPGQKDKRAKNGSAILLISKKSICSWGSDPQKRIVVDTVDNVIKKSKSKSMFMKSTKSSVKLKLKGGAAVDPDSGMDDVAHVYGRGDDIYNVVLGMTEIQSGKNSFYKLQVLESDHGNRYWVFRSWGRIGTTIGGNKLENMDTAISAIQHFRRLYEDKTGNMWEDRKNFQKVPGRFFPVDLDYGQSEDTLPTAGDESVSCTLPESVQKLVQLIFDVEIMKKVMMEFELDLQKMPLGKLSKKQIQQAYEVLTDLQELIKKGGSESRFLDASNRFYTLVPHDFGVDNPPILNTEDMIKQKIEMLESLMEIEIAYNMLKTKSEGDEEMHPLDAHYKKLNTNIEEVDKNSKEFELLLKYVKNTHAKTHGSYELEILNAFKVKRHGEDKRFKPFRKLHNRKLLWHGSRLTNYAGILSQGLRIAPPEAPATGYMFGKGIYFADMVSKSANYCCTSPNNPTGLMLLCEVALGNMYERSNADYIEKLPKGMHSTKGLGRTEPDPKEVHMTEDGVEIPFGKGKNVGRKDVYLLYNEFIVYDVAQVNIQYLLEMNFKYKYRGY
ncbi:hypothetical protein L9F63_013086 [Diploptera punctata]|uniref:Poly [ADP-ribose] polymerase n=1 Tax=Diploptera punctata TaxID=6984 RepID=A0AAD8EMI2_DIPPU|nr:hypothetical protein L9F63_013086 [Diploptera punctata]